jgi:4-aminobutyrate aminotransferase-like enzyme
MIIKFMNTALEFAPPLVISKADIDEAVRILDHCNTEEEKPMSLGARQIGI